MGKLYVYADAMMLWRMHNIYEQHVVYYINVVWVVCCCICVDFLKLITMYMIHKKGAI